MGDEWRVVVEAHLSDARARNLRPSTIEQRRRALTRLRRWLGRDPLTARDDELAEFIARPTLSAEARATELSHLRQFFRWALRWGYLTVDPTINLERPRLPRRVPRPMSEGDLAMALDLAPERIRPWLLLAGWAGLRCAEIAQLRAEDILWHTDPAIIVITAGKGGHAGTVPMGRWLAAELHSCGLPRKGWLFPRRDGQAGHVPAHLVSQLTNRFLREIGIDATMHMLRHRFGTQAYRASGRDLRLTQELLRHASPASTQRYTWVDPVEATLTVDALPVV